MQRRQAELLPPTRWLVPTVRLGRARRSVWQVAALTGYAIGSIGSITLAWATGDDPLGVALLALGAAASFLAVTAITLVVTGEEIYVFFHHAIAVSLTTWILAGASGLGLATSMDYTLIGLGLCLAVGRVGCLFVGCCYGRPSRHGVVYGTRHCDHGFPHQLVGCRLVPIQAIEAAMVAVLTIVAIDLVVLDARAGTSAATWLAWYAAGRFVLEYLRGEPDRPGAAGLNHAQWTAVAVATSVLVPRPSVAVVPAMAVAALAVTTVAGFVFDGRAPTRHSAST